VILRIDARPEQFVEATTPIARSSGQRSHAAGLRQASRAPNENTGHQADVTAPQIYRPAGYRDRHVLSL
jgi:hypothetical protein